MRTLVEATEARIRQLEQIQAACASTIAAERELLRIQRATPGNNRSPGAWAVRRESKNGKGRPARSTAGTTPLSARKQIVKLLEDNYPKDFDPREVSRKTGVTKRSPDASPRTHSWRARIKKEKSIRTEPAATARLRPQSEAGPSDKQSTHGLPIKLLQAAHDQCRIEHGQPAGHRRDRNMRVLWRQRASQPLACVYQRVQQHQLL
jgi:hypothetical protein